jgi:hypothetical protein
MKVKLLMGLFSVMLLAVSCEREADIASRNVSLAADDFQINRRITFYNGITGEAMLVIEGLCSLGNRDDVGKLSVTCKTGPRSYKKHFLGLSDNVSFIAEQIADAPVNVYQSSVQINPRAILPDISVRR